MGRDCCPHANCFLCGTKCSSGRKGSGDRCREEVCPVQRFVIQPYFLFRWLSSLLSDDAHRFITEIGRRMTFSTGDPRETAFLYPCISVAIHRYNAVCLTNTFIYNRRSHSGHYHLHRHRRRLHNNNNNNNNTMKWNMLSSEYKTLMKTCRNLKDFLPEYL